MARVEQVHRQTRARLGQLVGGLWPVVVVVDDKDGEQETC